MKTYDKLSNLKNSKSICLISHISPDADALASMIVLKEFLKQHLGIKIVDIFSECEEIPHVYEEILGKEKINKSKKNYETAIILDCPNLERTGIYRDLFICAKNKYVIDHHATNEFFGDVNVVEMCSSTCEIIYSILKHFRYEISKTNQGKIYAGMITDTNNFSVGNFNKRTFKIASECVDNINKTAIHNHFLSNNSMNQMNILSTAIQNLTSFNHSQILISHITLKESLNHKGSEDDFSGIINKLATISGSKLVCFIYPKQNGFYVSMRAKEGFDVATIAKKFGGGGHTGAAAYLSNDEIYKIEENIIKEFRNQVENTKPKCDKIF